MINPLFKKEALDEIDRCVDNGMVMLGELYDAVKISDPLYYPIVERCIQHKIPLMLHGVTTLGNWRPGYLPTNPPNSSVPEDLLALINQYGGEIPETYGVPVEEIQKGIKSGVRKVNIDTDNRLAITAAVREALAANPKEFDPRHFLKPSIKYMQKVCADRYVQFGTAGNASKIKQVSLEDFAAKYAKGELVMRAAAKV